MTQLKEKNCTKHKFIDNNIRKSTDLFIVNVIKQLILIVIMNIVGEILRQFHIRLLKKIKTLYHLDKILVNTFLSPSEKHNKIM